MTSDLDDILQSAETAAKSNAIVEAIGLYEKAQTQAPKDIHILNNLSFLYARNNELAKAKDTLNLAIETSPEAAFLYKQLGSVYKRLGDYPSAKQAMLKAVDLNKHDASGHNNLGLLLYQEAYYEQAEMHFREALKLEKDYIGAMYNLALCYKTQDKTEDAIACLLGITKANPDYVQAYFLLGKILLEKKANDEAKKYFEKIIARYPDDIDILQNIVVAMLDYDAYSDAKPYCLSILKQNPEHYLTLYNLGVIAEKEHNKPEAVDYYQKALSIVSNHFDSLNNLGVLYLEQQNHAEAEKCFKKALELQPKNEALQYTLSAVEGNQKTKAAPNTFIRSLFDNYADHFDTHLKDSLNYQVPQLIYTAVQAVKTNTDKIKLLDLGCGTGLAAELFSNEAERIVGVDLSEKMLEVASKKNLYTELHHSEICDYLDKTDLSFNVVIAADVFVYIGDLNETFKKTKARLDKGGLFAFSVEGIQSGDFKLQKTGRFAHSASYIQFLADQYGFEVAYCEQAVTREENHQPVTGHILVLSKQ